MFVGEHVCRPSLLCNPVYDKIDNNNNNNNNKSIKHNASIIGSVWLKVLIKIDIL